MEISFIRVCLGKVLKSAKVTPVPSTPLELNLATSSTPVDVFKVSTFAELEDGVNCEISKLFSSAGKLGGGLSAGTTGPVMVEVIDKR